MKLYSRGQVVIVAAGSVLLVFFLLVGFGVISLGSGNTPKTDTVATTAAAKKAESSFVLQTSEETPSEVYRVSTGEESRFSVEEQENISIYESLNKGVVNITTEMLRYNWFLEPVPSEGGTGSGSIIDKRGYVLTNYHVVKDAYKLYINLYDGSQYIGKVVGKDRENDLAVVKFDPKGKNLITVPFGESTGLKVGQKVLAIGNPFGYDRTLTTGIVSGLGRPVRTSGNLVIQGMIQTDASINPGNSGGPLIDSRGRMIGINTMIYSPSGGSVGIGFAIPVNTARRVAPDLITLGHVNRGWIDFYPVQLDPNIVRYGKLSVDRGILVSKVGRGTNADKAGIKGGDTDNPVQYGKSIIYFGGDVIVKVDGFETATLADLFSALEDNKPGDVVEVELVRGKKRITVKVVLSERPEDLLL
ncbi:MAG: peptidase S1 [Spirochaetes bacterium]|nr:MAG: peptidase S1 [Spirochaetota bacterium]